jgi:signal transduction histidine kinase
VLAVEDAGPGVPPGERERIFERFTQLDSGATRRPREAADGVLANAASTR